MIGIEYILAFTMAITNIFKKYLPPPAVPIVTILITVALHVANAAMCNASIVNAGQSAFITSGIAVGMFAAGDAVRRCPYNNIKDCRDKIE